MMEPESGDGYVRSLAAFIRKNQASLAQATFARPLKASDPTPLVLATDHLHLFYILIRLEALALPVGSLDVLFDSPSRPLSYVGFYDKPETSSLASFRSTVSKLSLASVWWSRQESLSIDDELKFIFSTFTKIPALSIRAPGPKSIQELLSDPPDRSALPLDVFKNMQRLECEDIDPRIIIGWDRLAESLRSLKIKRSGLEDLSDIFIGAVLDDQARRLHQSRHRNVLRRTLSSVQEEGDTLSPRSPLSSLKWAFLRHLYLPDNALTFFPTDILSLLTSVTHLDLSSNLFVSIPSGLGTLHNLSSLNLSDNLIDSVLGIYLNLGQILHLNLSHNRLESICGLERLLALERLDLRSNLLDESAEVGRLVTLPHITHIWVQGNPFIDVEPSYRVTLFDLFRKTGCDLILDGTRPGYLESFGLSPLLSEHVMPTRTTPETYSQPAITTPSPSALPSPTTVTQASTKSRRKKPMRIVQLGNDDGLIIPISVPDEQPSQRSGHSRHQTEHLPRDQSAGNGSSKSHIRQKRQSASVYETPLPLESVDYRKTVEGLKKDMGDGWLKVYSQSQLKTS